MFIEQAARIALALGLAGVALHLSLGYRRENVRWIALIFGLGVSIMHVVATGVLWWVAPLASVKHR